jgi:Bacterial SH3 domain
MATVDITDVRPNRNRFIEGRPNPPPELWAPPLAPDGTMAAGHVLLGEDTIHAAMGDEDPFQPPDPSNSSDTFGSSRKLIAGAAIIAALAVVGLTDFFLASPEAKAPAETAGHALSEPPAQAALNVPEPSSPTRVESLSETPVQPAPIVLSSVVPWPDVAAPLTTEGRPQVAPSAVPPPDLVFLQRPGVNIRSAPSGNAPVLGTAPRGTQFTATSRDGDWVQVENTRMKGWINSQYLAPNKPQ